MNITANILKIDTLNQSTDRGHAEVIGTAQTQAGDTGFVGVAQGHSVVGQTSQNRAVVVVHTQVVALGIGLGSTVETVVFVGHVSRSHGHTSEAGGHVSNGVLPAGIKHGSAGRRTVTTILQGVAIGANSDTVNPASTSQTSTVGLVSKSTATRRGTNQTAAAQLAEQAGVGADAGSAGVHVQSSSQGTGRAGQVTGDDGTETAGQTNEAVTAGPGAGGGVGADAAFELEHSFQAVAQVFSTLEAQVGGVGGDAVGGAELIAGSGGAGGTHVVEGGVSNTVDGDVGLSESRSGGEAGDGEGDQLLLHIDLLIIGGGYPESSHSRVDRILARGIGPGQPGFGLGRL